MISFLPFFSQQRAVKRLLRTDTPEAAEGMAIDKHLSLAEVLHVDKGVTHLIDRESTDKHTRLFFAIAHVEMSAEVYIRLVCLQRQCVGIVGDEAYLPVLEVVGQVMLTVSRRDSDIARDTLVVLDGPTEVDTSHGFHQDVEP